MIAAHGVPVAGAAGHDRAHDDPGRRSAAAARARRAPSTTTQARPAGRGADAPAARPGARPGWRRSPAHRPGQGLAEDGGAAGRTPRSSTSAGRRSARRPSGTRSSAASSSSCAEPHQVERGEQQAAEEVARRAAPGTRRAARPGTTSAPPPAAQRGDQREDREAEVGLGGQRVAVSSAAGSSGPRRRAASARAARTASRRRGTAPAVRPARGPSASAGASSARTCRPGRSRPATSSRQQRPVALAARARRPARRRARRRRPRRRAARPPRRRPAPPAAAGACSPAPRRRGRGPRATTSSVASTPSGSTPSNGSSSSSSRGSANTASSTDSRRPMPCEKPAVVRSAAPEQVEPRAAGRSRAVLPAGGQAAQPGGQLQVLPGRGPRHQAADVGAVADQRADAGGVARGVAPGRRRPVPPVGGSTPASTRIVVLLPAPLRPTSATDVPAPTDRSKPGDGPHRRRSRRRARRPAGRPRLSLFGGAGPPEPAVRRPGCRAGPAGFSRAGRRTARRRRRPNSAMTTARLSLSEGVSWPPSSVQSTGEHAEPADRLGLGHRPVGLVDARPAPRRAGPGPRRGRRPACPPAGPRRSATARRASGSSVTRQAMYGCWSPTTMHWLTSGCARSRSSSTAGATFLPPAVTMSSFLRPVIVQEAVVVELPDVAGVEPAVPQASAVAASVAPVAAVDVARRP